MFYTWREFAIVMIIVIYPIVMAIVVIVILLFSWLLSLNYMKTVVF